MRQIVVCTSAYGADDVRARGQAFYLPVIAQAGADGVEIRRELFVGSEWRSQLSEIRETAEESGLFVVYSAPLAIWREEGRLNEEEMREALHEARELGARWAKFSLGSYQGSVSDLGTLHKLMQEEGVPITVENDQTVEGGQWALLREFLLECEEQEVPIWMTFDLGNWKWTGEDASVAARELAPYVKYVHCKYVERRGEKLVTLPLPDSNERQDEEWLSLLSRLPADVPRAIEFPLVGADLAGVTRTFAKRLAEVGLSKEERLYATL